MFDTENLTEKLEFCIIKLKYSKENKCGFRNRKNKK
jgi:hypothetical protein